jgi:hypothetical protein
MIRTMATMKMKVPTRLLTGCVLSGSDRILHDISEPNCSFEMIGT